MPLNNTSRTFSPRQLPRSSTPFMILIARVQILSVDTLLAYARVLQLLFLMASGSTSQIMMRQRSLLSLARGTPGLFFSNQVNQRKYSPLVLYQHLPS